MDPSRSGVSWLQPGSAPDAGRDASDAGVQPSGPGGLVIRRLLYALDEKPGLEAWLDVHPILLGIYPVLHLFSANMREFPLRVLWVPVSVAAVLSGLVWVAIAAGLRLLSDAKVKPRQLRRRAACLTSILVVSVWTYGRLLDMLGGSELAAAGILAVVIVPLAGVTWRARGDLRAAAIVLDVFGGSLVVLVASSILYFAVRHADASWLEPRSRPKECSVAQPADARHPMIFHIVLDGYGRGDTLDELYGLDNSDFIGWLEGHGFFVATKSRSNYTHTVLSLASMLNMEYLDELAAEVGTRARDQEPLRRRVAALRRRATRLLRSTLASGRRTFLRHRSISNSGSTTNSTAAYSQ